MKNGIYIAALVPLAFTGCVVERPVPVTTTEVHREIVTTAPVAGGVVVERTPPAVRIETQTVSPGPGYVWTRGHWRWTGTDYVWVRGGWVVRPQPAAAWVEGHWVRRPGGWVWVEGYWR